MPDVLFGLLLIVISWVLISFTFSAQKDVIETHQTTLLIFNALIFLFLYLMGSVCFSTFLLIHYTFRQFSWWSIVFFPILISPIFLFFHAYLKIDKRIERKLNIEKSEAQDEYADHLKHVVKECSLLLGLPYVPDVRISSKRNFSPALYGRSKRKLRIAFPENFDEILRNASQGDACNKSILEKYVVLHELSHVANGDSLYASLFFSLSRTVKLYLAIVYPSSVIAMILWQFTQQNILTQPYIILPLLLFFGFFAISLRVLRVRELLADARASLFLRDELLTVYEGKTLFDHFHKIMSMYMKLSANPALNTRIIILFRKFPLLDQMISVSYQLIESWFRLMVRLLDIHPKVEVRERSLKERRYIAISLPVPSLTTSALIGISFVCTISSAALLVILIESSRDLLGLATLPALTNIYASITLPASGFVMISLYLLPLKKYIASTELSLFRHSVLLLRSYVASYSAACMIFFLVAMAQGAKLLEILVLFAPVFLLAYGLTVFLSALEISGLRAFFGTRDSRELARAVWKYVLPSLIAIMVLCLPVLIFSNNVLLSVIGMCGGALFAAFLIPHARVSGLTEDMFAIFSVGNRMLVTLYDDSFDKYSRIALPLYMVLVFVPVAYAGFIASHLVSHFFNRLQSPILKDSRMLVLLLFALGGIAALRKTRSYAVRGGLRGTSRKVFQLAQVFKRFSVKSQSSFSMVIRMLTLKHSENATNRSWVYPELLFATEIFRNLTALDTSLNEDTQRSLVTYLKVLENASGGFCIQIGLPAKLVSTCYSLEILDSFMRKEEIAQAFDCATHTDFILRKYTPEGCFRERYSQRHELENALFALTSLKILGALSQIDAKKTAERVSEAWHLSDKSYYLTYCYLKSLEILGFLTPVAKAEVGRLWVQSHLPRILNMPLIKNYEEFSCFLEIVEMVSIKSDMMTLLKERFSKESPELLEEYQRLCKLFEV